MRVKLFLPLIAIPIMLTAENTHIQTIKPTLDVGIIVSDMDKAKAFYGGVLGLKEGPPLAMPDGTSMIRYLAGTTTLKLRAFPNAPKHPGATRAAVGFRLLTLYFSDIAPILKRSTEHGGPEPRLATGMAKGVKVAFLSDPDGNQIEIVGMPPEVEVAALDKIAVGLTVSDAEKSREFYGKILGLHEDEPLTPAMLNGAKEYLFMAGKTQIKFWIGQGDALPKHTGNITDALGFRYFTFMVDDVDAVAALLKSRDAKIVMPPRDFGTLARIMMIADPDGNWIEFASLKTRPPANP
jgi:catechol 2,3-dioxygenase-like lactoylglutathione lyase family enzyme